MKRTPRSQDRAGAALVVVMILVLSLVTIVGAFAFAMKVETRLAHRSASSPELEWMGRSGIEYAKWVLDTQRRIPGEAGFDSLNQFWAGGPGMVGNVDDPFAGLTLQGVPIGDGNVAIRITDTERKLNVNNLNPTQALHVLQALGLGSADAGTISDAIRDWRDRDDLDSGPVPAETDYYLGQNPPYRAKNGPVDDISELLRIRGVTPELYWGGTSGDLESLGGGGGLRDILCAVSNGRVNINTAPEPVLRVVFDGNEAAMTLLLERRRGGDGVDGTEDDAPFRTPGEATAMLAGGTSQMASLISTQSSTFDVHVTAEWGGVKKSFRGLVRRGQGRTLETLVFHPD